MSDFYQQPHIAALWDRTMHSLEAEQAVLGSLILDGLMAVEKAREILRPDDFYRDVHRTIYERIIEMADVGTEIDIVTVGHALERSDDIERCGGHTYLLNLLEVPSTPANVGHYAGIVEEKSLRRRLMDAGVQIQRMALGEEREAYVALEESEKLLLSLMEQRQRGQWAALPPLVLDRLRHFEERLSGQREQRGLRLPWEDLDWMLSGLRPATLTTVGARPGMGKSSFLLQCVYEAGVAQKVPCALFSMEMPKEELVDRMICSEMRVDAHRFATGYARMDDIERVERARTAFDAAPVWIDDAREQTIGAIRSKCRRLQAEHGLGLIGVDYLQLISGDRRSFNRQEEMAEVVKGLKTLAREMNCPVVALMQLNRELEKRPDKRPILSDIRESGQIEAESDCVIFLYRDDYYDKDAKDSGATAAGEVLDPTLPREAEFIVAKHRSGKTGKALAAWFGHWTRFDNLSTDRDPFRDEDEDDNRGR